MEMEILQKQPNLFSISMNMMGMLVQRQYFNGTNGFIDGMQGNGEGVIASVNEVKSGTVDSIDVIRSSNNFSINSQLYFDNRGTEGSEVESIISSVKGENVNYLECKENKVVNFCN